MSAAKILKFRVKNIPRKLSNSMGPGGGPKGRIMMLRNHVTSLFRHERIEFKHLQIADETRGYAERLIQDAIRFGAAHEATMENADFWLAEKDLVPKLFEVFAPRYQNYDTCYTKIYRLPFEYPGNVRFTKCILELKGNPWPPVISHYTDNRNTLSNILLHELKKEYRQEKADRLRASTKENSPILTVESFVKEEEVTS